MNIEDLDSVNPDEMEFEDLHPDDQEISKRQAKDDAAFQAWLAKQPKQQTAEGLVVKVLREIAVAIKDGNAYCTPWCDVKRFYKKMNNEYSGPPRSLPIGLATQRCCHLQEEVNEYASACGREQNEEAFDALIDIVYVALGTMYLHGFPFMLGWERVHKANMQKYSDGEGEKQGVKKPKGWQPPYLGDLV